MSKRGRTFRHVRPRSFFKRYFYYFYPVPKWQTAWLLVLRVLVGAWLGRWLRCRCRLRLRRRLGLRCRLRLGRRFRLGRRLRLGRGSGCRCRRSIRSTVTRSSGLLLEGQCKSQDVVLILIGPFACIACDPIANGTVLEHLAKDRKKYGDESNQHQEQHERDATAGNNCLNTRRTIVVAIHTDRGNGAKDDRQDPCDNNWRPGPSKTREGTKRRTAWSCCA